MLLLFRDVLRFGCHHGLVVGLLVLPYLLLIILSKLAATLWAAQQPVWHGVYLAVLLALYPLYTGRLINYLAQLAGPATEVPATLHVDALQWRRLFLVNLVVTLTVTMGLFLMILPGIYLAARLAYAEFATLLRGTGIGDSLNLSWEETQRQLWPLFFGTLAVLAVSTLLELPLRPPAEATTSLHLLAAAADEAVALLTSLALTVFYFRVYCLPRQAD